MCLMTNPEYEREKNKLVRLNSNDYSILAEDLIVLNDKHGRPAQYVRQYIHLASEARKFGLDGLVIGTTAHIQDNEIERARVYAGEEMLVLLPGIGEQGGEASSIWKYFGRNKVIANVGRDLMFPNGSNSTPEQQAERAKYYMEMLNELRKTA